MSAAPSRMLPVMLTIIATLGGLLFGYDTAVISGAIDSIDANFILPLNLAETARDNLSGLTISSALFGCIFGGAGAGWLADRFGRRNALLLSALLFLVCSIGSAVPELGLGPIGLMGPGALVPFNIYRIIGGIGVGIASMVSPMYIAEIAPQHIRGRLVSFNQIAIIFGMVCVYFINWHIAGLGDETWLHQIGWRWMFASEAVPSVIFAVLLLLVPDSPRWLVLKHRENEAKAVLIRLGGTDHANETLAEIKGSLMVSHEKLFAFGSMVIVVGVLLSVFQQFVGINAVLYYAPMMFRDMGASTDSSLLQTLVACVTVDRVGRKPLMLAGALIMAAAMVTLGTLFATNVLGFIALIAMLVYIAGFALSWGPVTWVLLSEIFPNAIKGRAMGIAVAAQWIANLLVSWSFKVLDGNSALNQAFNHGFAYWIYGVMSLVAAWVVWRFVPETKGLSLEAIQTLWRPQAKATVKAEATA